MNGMNFGYRFDFQNYRALYDKVESVSALQREISIHQGEGNLRPISHPTKAHFSTQTILIRRLQQSWPELSMDSNGSAHDVVSEVAK